MQTLESKFRTYIVCKPCTVTLVSMYMLRYTYQIIFPCTHFHPIAGQWHLCSPTVSILPLYLIHDHITESCRHRMAAWLFICMCTSELPWLVSYLNTTSAWDTIRTPIVTTHLIYDWSSGSSNKIIHTLMQYLSPSTGTNKRLAARCLSHL